MHMLAAELSAVLVPVCILQSFHIDSAGGFSSALYLLRQLQVPTVQAAEEHGAAIPESAAQGLGHISSSATGTAKLAGAHGSSR